MILVLLILLGLALFVVAAAIAVLMLLTGWPNTVVAEAKLIALIAGGVLIYTCVKYDLGPVALLAGLVALAFYCATYISNRGEPWGPAMIDPPLYGLRDDAMVLDEDDACLALLTEADEVDEAAQGDSRSAD